MSKIETEKIDCLHRPCSRPAPRGKIKSVRKHSEVIEQFDSFSLLKLLFLVRNWHCWSRKAFTRQMTPQIREETAKTAFFDSADRHEKLYGRSRLYASAQGRHETGGVLSLLSSLSSDISIKNSMQRWSSDFQGLFCVKIRKMAQGSNDLSTLPLKEKVIVRQQWRIWTFVMADPKVRSCTILILCTLDAIQINIWIFLGSKQVKDPGNCSHRVACTRNIFHAILRVQKLSVIWQSWMHTFCTNALQMLAHMLQLCDHQILSNSRRLYCRNYDKSQGLVVSDHSFWVEGPVGRVAHSYNVGSQQGYRLKFQLHCLAVALFEWSILPVATKSKEWKNVLWLKQLRRCCELHYDCSSVWRQKFFKK